MERATSTSSNATAGQDDPERDARGRIGAEGGTRTPTGCPTRPSNVRVCQFRHFGSSEVAVCRGRARLVNPSALARALGAARSPPEADRAPHARLPEPRVESVADAFAEKIVREHRDQDGETG